MYKERRAAESRRLFLTEREAIPNSRALSASGGDKKPVLPLTSEMLAKPSRRETQRISRHSFLTERVVCLSASGGDRKPVLTRSKAAFTS